MNDLVNVVRDWTVYHVQYGWVEEYDVAPTWLLVIVALTVMFVVGGITGAVFEHITEDNSKIGNEAVAFVAVLAGFLAPLAVVALVLYGLYKLIGPIVDLVLILTDGAQQVYRLIRPKKVRVPKMRVVK